MQPLRSLRRLLAAFALGVFVCALLMPMVTALSGHDSACAQGCEDDCEPGCLACGCVDRGLLDLPAALALPARTHEVAPVALLEHERPAERSSPPPYRPPRA